MCCRVVAVAVLWLLQLLQCCGCCSCCSVVAVALALLTVLRSSSLCYVALTYRSSSLCYVALTCAIHFPSELVLYRLELAWPIQLHPVSKVQLVLYRSSSLCSFSYNSYVLVLYRSSSLCYVALTFAIELVLYLFELRS